MLNEQQLEELMIIFLEEFDHYKNKKDFMEILDDELCTREDFANDKSANVNQFGSNRHCYIILII